MSDKVFIDTNIFLYAHSVSDEAKREAARALIFKHYADKTSVISTQVLAEFFQNYVAKIGGDYLAALKEMHFMSSGSVVEQTISLLSAGTKLWHEFSLSYRDALIVVRLRQYQA